MKASITVHMDTAAFEDYHELPRILRQLGDTIEPYGCCPEPGDLYNLHDRDGNPVGRCLIEAH